MRFRWLGLGLAWLIALSGWVYVALLPDIYEAETRFYVDTSSMLEPLLEDQIISSDPEEQLAFLREALLGRAQLQEVARQTGLDADVTTPAANEAMLGSLRDNVRFSAVSTNTGSRSRDQIYELRFRHQNRDKALAVVEALLNSFIESAIGEARQDDDARLAFLTDAISERETEVRNREREIADFKRENADRLPGEQGTYLARRQAEADALAERRRDLRNLESRRERQLEQLDQLRERVANATAEPPPNSLAARIRDTQLRIDELLLRLTPNNPDVIDQMEILEGLKVQRAAELEAQGLSGVDLQTVTLEANPVYQETQIQLYATELEIAELVSEIAEREASLRQLEDIIDESLENEARMSELTSSLGGARDQLTALQRDRQQLILTLQASVADQMDFRTINEPNVSLYPVEPQRLKLALAVFMVALGGGAVVCYGLAQLRPVFSSARALREAAELPVLGTVSNAWPASERTRFRRSILGFTLALLMIFVAMAGVAGLEIVGPGLHSPFVRG